MSLCADADTSADVIHCDLPLRNSGSCRSGDVRWLPGKKQRQLRLENRIILIHLFLQLGCPHLKHGGSHGLECGAAGCQSHACGVTVTPRRNRVYADRMVPLLPAACWAVLAATASIWCYWYLS